MIQDVTQKALDGKVNAVLPALKRIGNYGVNVSRDWFTNPANGWAKLSEGTIKTRKRKMTKGKLKKAQVLVDEASGDTTAAFKPLIDTDQLRKSITYVLDKKGARKGP